MFIFELSCYKKFNNSVIIIFLKNYNWKNKQTNTGHTGKCLHGKILVIIWDACGSKRLETVWNLEKWWKAIKDSRLDKERNWTLISKTKGKRTKCLYSSSVVTRNLIIQLLHYNFFKKLQLKKQTNTQWLEQNRRIHEINTWINVKIKD